MPAEDEIVAVEQCARFAQYFMAAGLPVLAAAAEWLGTMYQAFIRLKKNLASRFRMQRPALGGPQDSGFARLLRSRDSKSFVAFVGVTPLLFDYICDLTKQELQHRVDGVRAPGRPFLLNYEFMVGLTLRRLTGYVDTTGLAVEFGITEGHVNKAFNTTMAILHTVLKKCPLAAVAWPGHEKIKAFARQILHKGKVVEGVARSRWPAGLDCIPFAWIDGTVFDIPKPAGDIQQEFYSGKHSKHCVNNVFVFAPDGTVIWYNVNRPGKRHDYHLAKPLLHEVLQNPDLTPTGYGVMGDVGFRAKDAVHNFLTIRKNTAAELLRERDLTQRERQQVRYNESWIFKHRIAVEWCFQTLRTGFQRLQYRLPADKFQRNALLEVVVHLHNLRARFGGIPMQLKTVYAPIFAGESRSFAEAADTGGA